MEKRLLLAVGLCMGILLVWWKIFPPPTPGVTQPGTIGRALDSPTGSLPSMGVAPAAGYVAAEALASPTAAEEVVTLETPQARFELSSLGGVLRQVKLKDAKFLLKKGEPESGIELIRNVKPQIAPLRVTFPKADFILPDTVAWTVSRPAADAVTFRAETDMVAVEKRYRALPQRFRLGLEIVIQNKTDKPVSESLAVHVYGTQDPAKKGGGFLDYASANVAEMVCYANESPARSSIEALLKESDEKVGDVRWVASDEKFFAIALVPHPETPAQERKCGRRATDAVTGEAFLSFASRTVPPGGTTGYGFDVFAGPKYTSDLDQVNPGGQESHLSKVVNVTFAVLSRPLLYLLKTFQHFVGNWGFAIILLTIFVKLLTFYPTQRALMSGKRMQKLAPKMAELRKKHENDRQRLGAETMNMYKTHGVSPLGGCLPSLIQMPIWIALFSTLNYSVELYRADFLGYIHDLSSRDPYFISPLLMGGVMSFQMRMSPAGADPQQQKMMSIMMPIMFTGFSLFLPAGLAIYTLTSYLIGILQQLLVNHLEKKRVGHGSG